MILPPKRARPRRSTLRPAAAEPDTVRAFLVAPLVPAAAVGLGAMGAGFAFGCLALAFAAFAGYAVAILLGLPVYLVAPERMRRSSAATALAGGATAGIVPATALLLSGGRAEGLAWVAGVSALGCLGGLVFALIRNAPRPPLR